MDKFNRVIGLDDVMAVGDIACMISEDYPKGHPRIAAAGNPAGKESAKNLNEATFAHEFSYHDKGSMATIGKNRAVADLPGQSFSGFIAWVAWMAIHLMSLRV